MKWTIEAEVVTCRMEPEEFESLRQTLEGARDTTVPLGSQNFPADYAASLLDSMPPMQSNQGAEPLNS